METERWRKRFAEKMLCFVGKVLRFAEKTLCFVGKVLCFAEKTLRFAGKMLRFAEKTLCFVGKVLRFVGKTLRFVEKALRFMEKALRWLEGIPGGNRFHGKSMEEWKGTVSRSADTDEPHPMVNTDAAFSALMPASEVFCYVP